MIYKVKRSTDRYAWIPVEASLPRDAALLYANLLGGLKQFLGLEIEVKLESTELVEKSRRNWWEFFKEVPYTEEVKVEELWVFAVILGERGVFLGEPVHSYSGESEEEGDGE